MKLNRATRYALYAILELAKNPEKHISAIEIANQYNISVNHLVKVLHNLSRARLISSIRGAGGGHRFIGNPKRTTLYDIVSLFEDFGNGTTYLPEPGTETEIGQSLETVLNEIDDIAESTLRSISLTTFLKTMPPTESTSMINPPFD